MSVCDVCNANIENPNGYLLTTRQIVTNPAYWEKAFDRLGNLASLGANIEFLKGGLAEQQAKQVKPWLLCADCAEKLGLASAEARDHALRWWESGNTYAPPGSGPVPLSEVRISPLLAEVLTSEVPRPTRVLAFGWGFVPAQGDVLNAIQGMVKSKGKLTAAHFKDIPIESESRSAASLEAFFSVVAEVRRWNPSAFILDVLVIDKRAGRNTAMLAVWEGDSAEKARPHFPAVTSPLPPPATPAISPERRLPKKWTRVLGIVLIIFGIMMVISGASLRTARPQGRSLPKVGRPGAQRELTPAEAANINIGMGAVLGGIGIWLAARRRTKRAAPKA